LLKVASGGFTMPTRILAALLSIFVTGCYATTRHRADSLYARSLNVEKGKLVLITTASEEVQLDAPVEVSVKGDTVVLESPLLPRMSIDSARVDRFEVKTIDPARTGVLVAAGTLAVIGFVAASVAASIAIENSALLHPRWPVGP
jgi:hypothetical protein